MTLVARLVFKEVEVSGSNFDRLLLQEEHFKLVIMVWASFRFIFSFISCLLLPTRRVRLYPFPSFSSGKADNTLVVSFRYARPNFSFLALTINERTHTAIKLLILFCGLN
jgi:hypothetical protein